jgi:hypothetical protein
VARHGRGRDQPLREPDLLRIGKVFGRMVITRYPTGMAQGTAQAEAPVAVAGGCAGRIDLLLVVDDHGRPLLVVVEVKNTDWDARAAHRLRPNLARHAHQVRRYLDSLLPELETCELAGVQAALVYPRRPSLLGRAELVEGLLGEQGISVLFYKELEGGGGDGLAVLSSLKVVE